MKGITINIECIDTRTARARERTSPISGILGILEEVVYGNIK